MSTPHDYYGPYGDTVHLHSKGHNRPYVEPDYIGYDCDHQLPVVSSVGAGPRGHGLLANVEKNPVNGTTIVNFTDDVTGELIATTGNINSGYIWITKPEEDKVWEGQTSWFEVHICRGGEDEVYSVPVPPGAHGSRMYIYPDPLERSYAGKHPTTATYYSDATFSGEEVYSASDFYAKATFCGYGSSDWKDYPVPRPCDTVAFQAVDGNRRWLALGFIQAVEGNYAVWTAKTFIELSPPYIDKEGEWCVNGEKTGYKALPEIRGEYWYINGVSTGVKAQGPQGKQGVQGPQGDPGKQGVAGPQGDPGRDAKVAVGKVESLEPTQPATVTSKYDPKTNTTTLDFGIPEGAAGRAIIIDGGVYKYEDLPDWKSTPFNYAYIVDDGDGRYDLYIRGRVEADSELGGPWTVVEDWEGKPAIIEEATVDWLEQGEESYVDIRWTATVKANKYAFDFHLTPPDLTAILDAIAKLESDVANLTEELAQEKQAREDKDRELEDRLNALEDKLDQEIQDRLEAEAEINDRLDALEAKTEELESRIDDLESKVSELEEIIEDLQETIKELEKRIRDLEAQLDDLKDKIGELEDKIKELEDTIKELEDKIKDLEPEPEERPDWANSRFYIEGENLFVDDNYDNVEFYINDDTLYANVDDDSLTFYNDNGHVYVSKKE